MGMAEQTECRRPVNASEFVRKATTLRWTGHALVV